MADGSAISAAQVDRLYEKLRREQGASGYHLNPDESFTRDLIHGLLVNEERYGYQSCPCRLSSGDPDDDRDIVCPCDYRDPDLSEYGACYCGLYVSEAIAKGDATLKPIPERRPTPEERAEASKQQPDLGSLPYPVWRCRVCGYLCARDEPPERCPICKVTKDRFERFL